MSTPFKRADPTVDGFITRLAGWRSTAANRIRIAVHTAAPDVHESIKGKKEAHFDLDGPICFIKAYDTHINLVFDRGLELDVPEGTFKSYGKDQMGLIRVTHLEDLDPDQVQELTRQAVKLNQG